MIVALIISFVCGGIFGIILMALCTVARNYDREGGLKCYDGLGCGECSNSHYEKGKAEAIDELLALAKKNSIYGYSIALVDLESIAEQLNEQK